ncbi:SOS response-associated peptidase family protein [Acinetobacter baumannii]|uniref:SOS response-associated peptidase family protein n=1 Tax=Acinetobacter baumannii TaxID=470 RepID=UPI003F86CFC2
MCANFKPLKKEHSYQLDLLEPTFDYKSDVYPSDDCPIILSHQNEWEWRKVKFGMLPPYAKEVSFKYATYNARTETVDHKRSFKHAWSNDQFGLVPVEAIYEPKYINGKAHWYGIFRQDGKPFTLAAIYEETIIDEQKVRTMSLLTINADRHSFMKQFHKPDDEKRSIIVIPDHPRNDWLNCKHTDAPDFFLDMPLNEFTSLPKAEMNKSKNS